MLIISTHLLVTGRKLYSENRVDHQVKLLKYIRKNLSEKDVIIGDDWMFLDLKLPYLPKAAHFPLSEMAKKVDRDSETIEKLNNTYKSIDYIVDRQNLIDSYSVENKTILFNAYLNSQIIVDFTPHADSGDINVDKLIEEIKSGAKDQNNRYTLRKIKK